MKNIEALKLINRIQKEITDNGINSETLIPMLMELREMSKAEGYPRMTKVLRLSAEHLEENGDFLIAIPQDEAVEELDGEEVFVNNMDADPGVTGAESLDYMLSLMTDPTNKTNHTELGEYRDQLLD